MARAASFMMLIEILEQVLNGLLAGAYYLLIALGLTLIFSLGGLVNLAHGAFYALGAYFAVKLADALGFSGALVVSPLAVAAGVVGGLWYLLRRTPFGRVVRAGVQNPDMVAALGISLSPYMASVVALAVALAALAGVLLAPITGVHPAMGAEILTASFVVVVIGGLGSFWGVVWAAMIVGVVRGLTVYFFPPAAEASMYLLMVLVLLFRPRGLFGERIQRFE